MAGHRENKDFMEAMSIRYPLDEAIDWIGTNMCPEDVFSDSQLKTWAADWALDNDYIFEEEVK